MNPDVRRLALRAFLTERRNALTPRDVGLPAFGVRRVPGLRRDEVAELAGVSRQWYEQFEAGGGERRYSAAFVQRIADALRMDERERATLFRLALPEIDFAVDHFERSSRDGALQSLRQMRELVRRLTAVSSFEDAVQASVDVVASLIAPTCVAVANLLGSDGTPRPFAVGPKAGLACPSFADQCLAANYPGRFGLTTFNEERPAREDTSDGSFAFTQRTSNGKSFTVNVTSSPSVRHVGSRPVDNTANHGDGEIIVRDTAISADVYWEWNSRLRSRATLAHGLFKHSIYQGTLSALWTEPHAVSAFEIEVLQTASAIVELAAGKSGP
jgi:transcriptional regulator with XRE-family HTH domain